MEFTQQRTVKITAVLVLLAAISQPIYTVLYKYAPEIDRLFLWKLEALIFVLLAAFGGAAMVMTKRYALGFSAIAFSAVINLVQVGIGLTQFGPFRAATKTYEELGGVAFAVIALSFFLYNAAKILLGLAAIVFGKALMNDGKNLLGGITVLAGVAAFIANALVMMLGLNGFVASSLGGGSGVVATLLLALCLFSLRGDDSSKA